MIYFALKNLTRRKARTFLAILGITIGVAAVIALVSISEGLEHEASEAIGKIQNIMVWEDDVMDPVFSKISIDYAEKIENIKGVRVASPEIFAPVWNIDGKSIKMGPQMPSIIGIDPEKTRKRRGGAYSTRIIRGRTLTTHDKYSCVLGKIVADNFKKSVGSKIEVEGKSFRVVGIYESGSRAIDNYIAIPLEIAQEIVGFDKDEVSSINVETEDPSEMERIASIIELRFDELDAHTPEEMTEELESLMSTVRTASWAVSGIAAIVGGIGIANTMLMSVIERTREIGLLKAMGWSNLDVLKNILIESLVLGFIGGILGITLGIGTVFSIKISFPALTAVVTPSLALKAMVFAVSLGVLGGLYPAYRASRLNPVDALRFE
ncbi:MAG: ABC transporter permease [Candidatus Hydrothermarchaeota archaeon]